MYTAILASITFFFGLFVNLFEISLKGLDTYSWRHRILGGLIIKLLRLDSVDNLI